MKEENTTEHSPSLPGGLIPVDQWKQPEMSVQRTLKDAIRHLTAQLRAGMSSDEEPFQSLDDLPSLTDKQIQHIAPHPDFTALAGALLDSLAELRQSETLRREVAVVVAPPFSGVREALVRLPGLGAVSADAESWHLVAPPDNLLMNREGARRWWDEQDLTGPWVIPELADFWLRHTSGFALISELLQRMVSGQIGPGLVGCSSWCWQFWESYLPNAHLGPLTLAPLDADRLGQWLEYLAASRDGRAITARMTDDGLYVLPVENPPDAEKRKHSGFLRDLATASRGIPGVALAIWQRSLRARPEDEMEEDPDSQIRGPGGRSCWVVPLDQLSLPSMPQSSDRSIGFILHALLLHDGLDEERIALVTGVGEPELQLALSRLARADVVYEVEASGRWHVTPLGYPTVRRHLQSWGYPVDGF
ncbi:B3/4 domain-containing protein [Marinobacter szutsaonensis]